MPKAPESYKSTNPKKNGNGKKKGANAPKPASCEGKSAPAEDKSLPIVYPYIQVRYFCADPKDASPEFTGEDGKPLAQPLTVAIAKEIVGWTEETDKVKFGNSYLLTDKYGKKIRCLNNLTNRPFYPALAEDWMLETLRRKWTINGETMIVDRYGMIIDGQHRLIGLILAAQELEIDKARKEGKIGWSDFWDEEPYLEGLLVLGIDPAAAVTQGTGKRRSLEDELYRSKWFEGKNEKERFELARITANAVKMLWYRTAQDANSFAPKRPLSESLEFITNHPRIVESVRFIHDESGKERKLAPFTPSLGFASGLLYLMGCSSTDPSDEKNPSRYDVTLKESSLKWDLWDKAQDFWTDIASNGKATEGLREALLMIPAEASGQYVRDLRSGLIVKAWNVYSDGEKIVHKVDPETKEVLDSNIEVEQGRNELDEPTVTEIPRIGGIDVGALK
jgi:hypothetical protein